MSTVQSAIVCLCAVCSKPIQCGEDMAERRHYEFGELDEIELAHIACAQALPYVSAFKWNWGQGPEFFSTEADWFWSPARTAQVAQANLRREREAVIRRARENRYRPNNAIAIAYLAAQQAA